MFKLINNYSDIITSYKITRFEHFGDVLRFRAEFILSDYSKLYIRETVLGPLTRKYAYHWQDQTGKLIIRWDNAPDWDVTTFPHHKHIGRDDYVEASFERTLNQVLIFIKKKL
jgi:hypothetical protein